MIGGIGGFTPQPSTSKPAGWYSFRDGMAKKSEEKPATEEMAEEGEEGGEIAEEE